MSALIRVVIVDDHPVVRKGLRAFLSTLEGFELVGEAANVDEGAALVESVVPDVAIVDLNLPDATGIELTQRIRSACPSVRVLVLTMIDDDDSVLAVMRAGALGYVVKGADEDDFARALRAVAQGEAIIGPTIAQRLAALFAEEAHPAPVFPELTTRERQILDLIARGHSNVEIARHLELAPKTIRNQVSMVFVKIGVTRRSEAIVKARAAGLGMD